MNQTYAGFRVRLRASIIDSTFLSIPIYVIVLVVSLFGLKYGKSVYAQMQGFSYLVIFAIDFLYYVVYQQKHGQTIGKKAMKIRVVTADGKTPTMFTFFLREVIELFISELLLIGYLREVIGLFILSGLLSIGYLMVIWDVKKQALHDKIANTYVVYVEQPSTVQQAAPIKQQPITSQQQVVQQSTTQPAVVESQQPVTETKLP